MNAFIDTHCHLDAAEFGHNQAEILRDALAAGVSHLVVPAVERANFASVHNLCAQHSACYPAYGIHPMFTGKASPDDLDVLHDYLSRGCAVAVGEIGLDYYIKDYDQVRQEYFFIEQLKLAHEFELPVLLHTRSSVDTVLKHLRQNEVCGGIAHAFSGSPQQADELIKLGFKLGFGGAATYSRATRLRALATTLPLSCIVLETDAPDMRPEFIARGQPNKPEYLPRIAQILADLRGITLARFAEETTTNANAILNLSAPPGTSDMTLLLPPASTQTSVKGD